MWNSPDDRQLHWLSPYTEDKYYDPFEDVMKRVNQDAVVLFVLRGFTAGGRNIAAIDIQKYCEYADIKVAHINGSLYKHRWLNESTYKTRFERETKCMKQFGEAIYEDYKVFILDKPNLTHAEYYWYEQAARENLIEVQMVEFHFDWAREAILHVRHCNDPDFVSDEEIYEAYQSFEESCDFKDKSVIRYEDGYVDGFYHYLRYTCNRTDRSGKEIDDVTLSAARSTDPEYHSYRDDESILFSD